MGSRSTVQGDRIGTAGRRRKHDPVREGPVTSALDSLLGRLRLLEKEISEEKGEFTLFGLFLREESQDRWDVVAAAPWFADNKVAALGFLSKRIKDALEPGELLLVSRVIPITSKDRFLSAVRSLVEVNHGCERLEDVVLGDLPIKRAYVITSKGNGCYVSVGDICVRAKDGLNFVTATYDAEHPNRVELAHEQFPRWPARTGSSPRRMRKLRRDKAHQGVRI